MSNLDEILQPANSPAVTCQVDLFLLVLGIRGHLKPPGSVWRVERLFVKKSGEKETLIPQICLALFGAWKKKSHTYFPNDGE